jgi:hypothetical protein
MIRSVAKRRRDRVPGVTTWHIGVSRGQLGTLALIITACSTLAACTNSKFLVGYFYDRIDNKFLTAANEWLAPNPQQSAELRALTGTFHTWHRRTQMPEYAQTIRNITASIAEEGNTDPADVDLWIQSVRGHLDAIRQCDPGIYAIPAARTLTPEQVDRAERKWMEEREENEERFGSRTRKERIAHRVERLATWAGRLGLPLTEEQLALYEDTLRRQTSLSRQMRDVSGEWTRELLAIARQTGSTDYAERMSAHLEARFDLMESRYPEGWSRNRKLWRDFAIEFETTLSKKQRRDLTRWLNKFAQSLVGISRDTPDWLPADDPAYGCVVTADASNGGTAGAAGSALSEN